MCNILSIVNFHLLIENNHLNLYGISFTNESLEKALENMFSIPLINNMVTNTCSSFEITETQKQILQKKFPNLHTFIIQKN
jgi:hypothetical protein